MFQYIKFFSFLAFVMHHMIGGRLLLEGKGVREVSWLIGVSPSSVSRWKQQLKQGGLDALRTKPHLGRSLKLSAEQKKELEGILLKDARAAVFPTDLWT